MKRFTTASVLALLSLMPALTIAENISSLDGKTYTDVRNVVLKPAGLYFVIGTGESTKGVTIAYTNLSDEIKEKYHYNPYDAGLALARQNRPVALTKKLAFSMDQLDAAKKKAQAENKPMGFIMVWDSFFVPSEPMGQGGGCGLAHFYSVFHDNLVLVFVRHETELGIVPPAVGKGFYGPDEGGFAPNMAVVSPDCSEFICEIPYGGNGSNGQIREQIYRQKIEAINQYTKAHKAKAEQKPTS